MAELIRGNRRISSAAFTGRAVAPSAVQQPDPVTTNLISQNSLQLGVVASQIQGLTAQMQSVTGSLRVISNSLAVQQSLERQKEAQEAELERKLAEQKLREGKESQIERKMQAALVAPVQKIQGKVGGIMFNLKQAFFTLLGGWLLNQGVETINALVTGNKEKLNEIKNNIIKTFLVLGGLYAAISIGLKAIIGTFARVGFSILSAGARGLFRKPFASLISFLLSGVGLKAAINFLRGRGGNLASGALTSAANRPARKPPTGGGTQQPGGSNLAAQVTQGGATGALVNTVFGDGPLDERLVEGAGGGAAATLASAGTGMLFGGKGGLIKSLAQIAAGIFGYSMGSGAAGSAYRGMMGGGDADIDSISTDDAGTVNMDSVLGRGGPSMSDEDAVNTEEPAKYGEGKITPEEGASAEGTTNTFEISGSGTVNLDRPVGSEGKVGDKVVDPETLEYIDQEKYIGKYGQLPPGMISGTKKSRTVADMVSEAPPEPRVNVIPVPQEAPPASTVSPPAAATGGGVAASAPTFDTNNPDNFYSYLTPALFNVA